MKWLNVALLTVALTPAIVAIAGETPKPRHTKVAKIVNNKWVRANTSDPKSANKSENSLELLEMVQSGSIPLYVDVAQWAPPAPQTVAEGFWHLKNKTTAKDIKWTLNDFYLFDGRPVATVEDAIVGLSQKVNIQNAYEANNIDAWGIYHPNSNQEAIDILVEQARVMRVDFDAYKAAHP